MPPVIRANSNTAVMAQTGGFLSWPPAPIITGPIGPIPGLIPIPAPLAAQAIADGPTQVMGLVPLFPCCNNTIAGTDAQALADLITDSGDTIFSVTIGGVLYGYVSLTTGNSDATIEGKLNLILTPHGVSNIVTHGTPSSHKRIHLYAPLNSGAIWNGRTVVFAKTVGGGSVVDNVDFGGGIAPTINNGPLCDCRSGLYTADTIADDQQFTLPVFASLEQDGDYFNDKSSFLLQYSGTYNAISSNDFHLQQLSGGIWSDIETLNNSSFGSTFFQSNFDSTFCGFTLYWSLVFKIFGTGTFRFTVNGVGALGTPYCMQSPPFCLQEYSCQAVDGTVKFTTTNVGGNVGSATQQGTSWKLSYIHYKTIFGFSFPTIVPLTWNDSIRFPGFFGYETASYERDSIKYQTGVITKIRDEVIKKFSLISGRMPMWFHRTFYGYALMSDKLYVSDYNINNASYNYQNFWVVADSDYAPKYTTYSRYTKVMEVAFKEGQQYIFRDRCL